MNKIENWLNAIINEDGHKLSIGSLRTIEMIKKELRQNKCCCENQKIGQVTENSNRFFIDQRLGCIAIRDTAHPRYDADYPGLHHDTCDVVWFRLGYLDDNGEWNLLDSDIEAANMELKKIKP